MYLVSNISRSIWQLDSSDNFTTNMTKWLSICNVKEKHNTGIKVNYLWYMLRYFNWYLSLNYTEKALTYLAMQYWCEINGCKCFNLLFDTNTLKYDISAHYLFPFQHCLQKSNFHSVILQVNYIKQIHTNDVYWSMNWISLSNVFVDVDIVWFEL